MDGLPVDDQFVYINHATHKQTGFVHHMDLMALAFADVDFEPGRYPCEELYEGNTQTLMDDGLILYASQVGEDTAQLPPGIVAEIPAATQFLYEVHLVNSGDEDIQVQSYANGYTIPAEEVTGTIWGGPVRDRNLNIPGLTAQDEMCQVAIVFTPGKSATKCEVVETSDGEIVE